MDKSITITRTKHDGFTVEYNGETVRFDSCESIPELPDCWSRVNQLWYALKGAHGHLTGDLKLK